MWPEAMGDALKFTFNILTHYPKSLDGAPDENKVGDNWSPNLDPILPPLLRVFHALPPTSPAPVAAPLTHVCNPLLYCHPREPNPPRRLVWLLPTFEWVFLATGGG
ncbi:hypothetical protein DFH09DRAFT_580108 [Mycena vulgaris]|nr:hypothetical protein DFH09DRAFT_580108 [Mycena vulgaris]